MLGSGSGMLLEVATAVAPVWSSVHKTPGSYLPVLGLREPLVPRIAPLVPPASSRVTWLAMSCRREETCSPSSENNSIVIRSVAR